MIHKKGDDTVTVWNFGNSYFKLQSAVNKENDAVKEKVLSDDHKKSYMELYPDMYVDSIKPVIHLEEKKMAYISFDDGPSYITSDILKTLEDNNAKATFFILGCTITTEGEACLKEMVKQGHTIGIHTYSHNYKDIYSSVEAFLDDFYRDYLLIYETTGIKVNIFRFPWGSYNTYNKRIRNDLIAEMKRRGFTYYDWNISAEDSVGYPTEYRIKNNILKELDRFNNPIILMHDSSVNKITAKTLPDLLKSMKEKGYDFDTLDHREPYQFGN
ncbi:polysaccharide deacetylase family protein [Anaerocolumna sp. MB42-C2]|uniref:polysaccharide deacetylase family protein n=1 Tax=Anaerocolumna sp. MB42-C2 TaxID=3070997 RepID=UPI0027DF540A|nr:polysaccharide deacetylase family protein [Anaerocolumna sp. MB42-C2]WMJ87327.1 polysaccharide deacetylase family protein [Anaerocolumna sp. MB42-C2]